MRLTAGHAGSQQLQQTLNYVILEGFMSPSIDLGL
jgi:hypothetical protein